jgi:glycosyltransferase involved in cell wall biosynthesis
VNDSLSIVVPISNAESTLARQIHRLLDILPDLTNRFEVVIVDDASVDHTVDVARDLAAQFPQVRLIRHRQTLGTEAAVRTGLQWASGRTVFVQEDPASLSPTDLRRLWALRHDEELVMARSEPRPGIFDDRLLARLSQWGRKLQSLSPPAAGGGIHMIRRTAVERLLADSETEESAIPLAEADGQGDERLAGGPVVSERLIVTHESNDLARADLPHAIVGGPRQNSSFLGHLRNLALGE